MNIQVTLHYGVYQHIAPFWDGATYYGTTWRLYFNETHGAGVTTRYETLDMTPQHLYLFPPGLAFKTAQVGNPKQFGLHFHATPPYDHVQAKIYAVPLDDLLHELLAKTLAESRPPPHFLSDSGAMYATALTAAALAKIPPEYVEMKALDFRIEEAMQTFRDRIGETLSMEEISHQVGLSKGAFIRLFKKETGSTPYAWLMEIRMAWACDLLARDTIPIDLIAQYTGFNDRFHFSKVFKKWIGVPPAAYRKRAHSSGQ